MSRPGRGNPRWYCPVTPAEHTKAVERCRKKLEAVVDRWLAELTPTPVGEGRNEYMRVYMRKRRKGIPPGRRINRFISPETPSIPIPTVGWDESHLTERWADRKRRKKDPAEAGPVAAGQDGVSSRREG